MATIASLYVNLTASTASFTTQMEKAGKLLHHWGKGALNVAAMLAKVGAAAGAAALGGLALLTKSAADSIDRIGKLSDRLGIATEVYVGWEHAANLAGVGNEEFGKSLERMSRTLGEAALNGGTVADALERIGLNAQELANMGVQQQFEAIADKIAEIQNPAERALLAFTLFGRQGQALINLLATGSNGLRAAVTEAERLGITFSRLDAAKVEEANDNITRMQTLFKGLGTQVAIQIAPIISAITAKFLQFATTGDSLRERVGGAFRVVAKHAAFLYEVGKALGIVFNAVAGTVTGLFSGITAGLLHVLRAANAITGGLDKTIAAMEKLQKASGDFAVDRWQSAIEAFNSDLATNKVEAFLDEVDRAATAAAQPVLELNTAFEDMGVTFDELDEKTKAMEDMQREAERLFDETRTPMEKFEAEQARINRLFQEGLIDVETYERAMAKLREEQEAMTAAQVEQADVESAEERDAGAFRVIDRALLDFDRRMNDPNRSIIPKLDASNILLASIDRGIKAITEQGVA